MSVSVVSNVPKHGEARFYVTDGDSDTSVAAMISDLEAMSDTAFDLLKPRCEHMFD